ncbi:hypothetical protein KTH81_18075 [Lachnospiraceae bacterium ASD3451]|uniref:hypothetical protein n=1 Tax=Diplocloster agilis TaxID=2850323 RepID=UPI001E01B6BD|nr:hypothetical protein [Diplocloster agilis]MBU9745735.1 hypothetical protein [Diplocloster agilis]
MNLTINQKSYEVPQLGFKDMVHMESMGFSIIEMFQKQHFFSLAAAFVGVCTKCSREEAETLCEQHVLGGGNIEEIYTAFMDAVNSSGFFQKLLAKEESPQA